MIISILFYFLAKTSNLLVHLSFENSSGLTVFDNSGSGNDGRMQGAIIISPRYGKCGSAAVFFGGRILFDSKSFKRKPKTAVTVALWVKLNRISGTFSLFSVQRDSSGQGGKLELKVTAGIVQWTHINENQKVVFDIDSGSTPVVTAGQWTHVAATYDSYIFSTKLVVDSRLANEKEGNGLLSQQWLGEIGVALAEGVHGNVDEFYMFYRALSTPEIIDLQHKCDVPLGKFSPEGLQCIEMYRRVPMGFGDPLQFPPCMITSRGVGVASIPKPSTWNKKGEVFHCRNFILWYLADS